MSWEEILAALAPHGIVPRDGIHHPDNKDYRNWSEGMKRFLGTEFVLEPRGLGMGMDALSIKEKDDPRAVPDLDSYPLLDCDSEWYEDTRWVPCSAQNKPLLYWSEVRCRLNEARFWPGARYLAENLKGCRWIVLDFDVDHDKDNINLELREFGRKLLEEHPTQALYKPDWMGFHLTYWTDRDIRTKHLPHVGIDICGNSPTAITPSGKVTSGQLRYFKTKKANDVPAASLLTEDVWNKIQEYSLSKDVFRKVRNND